MSDPNPESAVATPPAPVIAARPRRGGGGMLVALLALAALAASGYAVWRDWQSERSQGERVRLARGEAEALQGRVTALERELENATQASRALERRFADADSVNRSLREELLGLSERASLLEDTLASLADRRLSGAAALHLNEAEYLLRMGSERLMLFRDPVATIAAFRLADAELAQLDDPLLAGVRQTLASEIAALATVDLGDAQGAVIQLDRLVAMAGDLPTRAEAMAQPAPADTGEEGYGDRLVGVLGQFVRVRRLDDAEIALTGPLQAQSARAAYALELLLAKAALAASDARRFRAALEAAGTRLAAGFAPEAAGVVDARDTLAALAALPLDAPMPAVGQALRELGNLRATRALRDGASNGAP